MPSNSALLSTDLSTRDDQTLRETPRTAPDIHSSAPNEGSFNLPGPSALYPAEDGLLANPTGGEAMGDGEEDPVAKYFQISDAAFVPEDNSEEALPTAPDSSQQDPAADTVPRPTGVYQPSSEEYAAANTLLGLDQPGPEDYTAASSLFSFSSSPRYGSDEDAHGELDDEACIRDALSKELERASTPDDVVMTDPQETPESEDLLRSEDTSCWLEEEEDEMEEVSLPVGAMHGLTPVISAPQWTCPQTRVTYDVCRYCGLSFTPEVNVTKQAHYAGDHRVHTICNEPNCFLGFENQPAKQAH